jgi:hypothetical protein
MMEKIGRRHARRMLAVLGTLACAAPSAVASAATIWGVAGGGSFLVRFDSATPGTIVDAAAITGLQPGERIVGIDFRPRTGQLYGIGIVAGATDTLREYTLDASSGVAKIIPGSTPVTALPLAAFYGVAFNPTTDRLRVVSTADENLRMNPNNGARADTPTNDLDINPGGLGIASVAYDRSFDTGLAVANRTTAFALSTVSNTLVRIGGVDQSPSPNGGQVMNALPLGQDALGDKGLDIDLDGTAYAALTIGVLNSLYTVSLAAGTASLVHTIGDGNLEVGGIAVVPPSVIAVASDLGSAPRVRVLDGESRAQRFDFAPFEATMKKGLHVALGDVTFDSVPDMIVAPGKGGPPEIRVFNGLNGLPVAALATIAAFDAGFKGGVFVASGDVNADGFKDVVAGAGPGGAPQVRVFSGTNADMLLDFPAFDAGFKGGVQVASADFDVDGDWEIVAATGKGAAPRVRVFDGAGNPFMPASLPNFDNDLTPYEATFKGGVFVAAGDVDGDGRADIITGPGKGHSPEVAVFNGVNGAEIARFLAFDKKVKAGVRVAVADVDADGRYEIVATLGSGKATEVHAFDATTLEEKTRFLAFDATFKKGAFVAGVRR